MDTAQVYDESAVEHDQSDTKFCRLCCGGSQQELCLIFPKGASHGSNKLLVKKIYECTTVQITNEGDDQRALICQACISKIDDFYTYREQCKVNDTRIRQRTNNCHQIQIKQEKDLHLDTNISESNLISEDVFQQEDSSQLRPASHSTAATSNEFNFAIFEPPTKDADSNLLQPFQRNSVQLMQDHSNDEITIKREVIEDDDVYYNSDGEAAGFAGPSEQQQYPAVSSDNLNKTKYRITMTSNNRERLLYQGYVYCRHSNRRDGAIHWRCRLGGCQAAVNLHLDGTVSFANANEHTHPPNVTADEEEEEMQTLEDNSELTIMNVEGGYEPLGEDDTTQEGTINNDADLVVVNSDSLQITTNKKKGETLVHLGFKYCKRYLKMDGSTFWKCRSNNNKCSAGVYVYPDSRVKYHGTHNHERVVNEEEDFDPDSTRDTMQHSYTIVEDVDEEDEEEEEVEQRHSGFNDDLAALVSDSLEVMMPEDRKQSSQEYEITTNVKGRECLIYEGHQYSKDRERYDGAVLWRCRRNYDKCRAVAIVYANGKVEKSGDHRHETDKRYLERKEQGKGSRMYRITKNQRGNDALVFDGHRFSKEWSRVDGSIIWRCSYKSGMCKTKVVLNNGLVHRMGNENGHDHEQTESVVTEPHCEEDWEVVDNSLIVPSRTQQTKLIIQPPLQHTSTFTAEQQVAGNYRIVKNRKGFEALVHDGYRYCKVRVRQDGSVKWLCKMNKKTCRAAVDLLTDGTVAKASEYDHNHERPTDMDAHEEDDEPDVPGLETTYPIDPEVFGNSQWYYVKNSKNGISMIHAGYRYTKKCDRVDGTSLWRCSASQRGCKAGVILFPNDTLAMVENAEHSHKPYEGINKADNESELDDTQTSLPDTKETKEKDDTASESDMNMQLLQTVLGGGEEVSWMGGDAENESVWFNSGADRPYPRPTSGQPNFRIIKNRRNTDSLVHRGYRYCKIRDRLDGSILWACQMNKKTCKASVNLGTDGRVEVINGKHNHEKTDVDDQCDESTTDQGLTYGESSSDVELALAEEKAASKTEPGKHPDYYYSTNKSNRECLIHKGYRFCKRSDRPDGSTVWRCSMGGNTCMVIVVIHADGTPEENSIKHNHYPLAELPPEIERTSKTQAAVPEEKLEKSTSYNRQGDTLEWNGFQYRKIKELPDNCIIWICQVESCRVAVKMLDGQLKMLSESEHNHTASSQSQQASSTANKPTTSSEGKTRNYRLFKNQRGQMTMLYKGYRYSIRNRNQDGSSSWKCRANNSCRVIIYLLPDDRIVFGSNNTVHNHEPNWESTKKLEVIAPTRVNPLYDYLNIIPGANSASPTQSTSENVKNQSAAPAAQASNSDSNNYGRNVIEHKGFYYRLVVRKKNGREYWRCVHFKSRACRAALFCRDNGTIITSSNGKDHNHGGGADAKPLPSNASNYSLSASKQASAISASQQARSAALPSPPEEVQLGDGDDERYIDHGDYVIAKNRKDQNTLIFKDRRYYLAYNRSDGSAVWRCAHRKRYKCYAYVRLRPDGRLMSTGDQEHSHSLKSEEHPPTSEEAVIGNYKIVKNRVGNDILIHDNHRFRLNYQRNDGTTHWRCVWARSNHCSAGIYLFANGALKNAANEAQITHNHPPPGQVKRSAANKDSALLEEVHDRADTGYNNRNQSRTIPEVEGITDYKIVEGPTKTIVCRGYRYWFTWVRKDGSIYYRCTELKKHQCPMGILLLSNGRLVGADGQSHNHDPSQEEGEEEFHGFPTEKQSLTLLQSEEELEHYPPLVVPSGGDADFKIVKTSRGESLIYKGYRYWAKNRLANGIVSLCCTRKKLKRCPAVLRLMTNGRVVDPLGVGHTHPPNIEGGLGSEVVMPVKSVPALTPKPSVFEHEEAPKAKASKLTALSFNEESDDETEDGDESIIGSRRYVFMKSTAQRNFIVFEGFLYDFEHKQHDGCVFYRCKTCETCPASLMLLTNGRVMNLDDSLHIHNKPDLSNFRPVGRGSKEFKIVQNKNGSNILVHRGHRYTTPRAKTDGAGIWYCHTYIPDVNRRCYVPIELLPNGRVAPVGEKQHNHAAPFKTKQDGLNDSKESMSSPKPEANNGVQGTESKMDNRMLLLGGHRYNFAQKREDGAILWKCVRKSCNASMYRLTDGQIVKGPDHNHEKMETTDSERGSNKRKYSEIETKPKISSPIVTEGDLKTSTPKSTYTAGRESLSYRGNPYIGQSIINDGYRYIYYLTRKDGSEHWRCCRRIPLKCRGGLYKQTDGSIAPSNDEGHTHPPDHLDYEDSIPMAYTGVEEIQNTNEVTEMPEEEEPSTSEQTGISNAEGTYDYELVDVKGKKRGLYLIYNGAMFVGGYIRRDRARYYRCRTVGCRVAMLLHKNGLLVPTNEHTHECQNASKFFDADKSVVNDSEDQPESENKKRRLDDEELSEEEEEEVEVPEGEDEQEEDDVAREGEDELLLESVANNVTGEQKETITNGSDSTADEIVQVKQEPVDEL